MCVCAFPCKLFVHGRVFVVFCPASPGVTEGGRTHTSQAGTERSNHLSLTSCRLILLLNNYASHHSLPHFSLSFIHTTTATVLFHIRCSGLLILLRTHPPIYYLYNTFKPHILRDPYHLVDSAIFHPTLLHEPRNRIGMYQRRKSDEMGPEERHGI